VEAVVAGTEAEVGTLATVKPEAGRTLVSAFEEAVKTEARLRIVVVEH